MDNSILIRTINMDCPICGKKHDVEERKRIATLLIKDERVNYEERFCYCENASDDENEFEIGNMTNENLLNARNAYRVKKGLLTSDDIVAIRKNYGLSQVDLAKLLGWGEATISRYESKAIQDEAYDNMLRLVKDNPFQALELLDKNGNRFTIEKRDEIHSKMVDRLNAYGKELLARQSFKSEYANFETPSDANGYTILDIDKIEAMVSYFAESTPDLYKVKLMKLLWYADALSYAEKETAMTGMVYKHESMGALPLGHYSLMNLENIVVKEETGYNYDSAFHIFPNKDIDYSVLNEEDKVILNIVIDKFKDYKTKDIVEYMHREKAYKETQSGDIMPFSLTKEISLI